MVAHAAGSQFNMKKYRCSEQTVLYDSKVNGSCSGSISIYDIVRCKIAVQG